MSDKMPITPRGLANLEEELKDLKGVQRPAVIQAISEARSLGDLSENAEYHSAKERQAFLEGRIAVLEGVISSALVIDPASLAGDSVTFGATCRIADAESGEEKTYQIVGKEEADLDKGLIALDSPLARALIGKSVGDEVEFASPRGRRSFELLSVEFK
jgi:transcription elongation factor GreA